jgi:CubicO group peptidase (beta-lactamase class C family)
MPELDDVLARLVVAAPPDGSSPVAPGAVVAVAARDDAGFRGATGASGVRSRLRPDAVTPETPFDLASVTKPVVACAVARLVRAKCLDWHCPLGTLLPELAECRAGDAPLITLLAHRAGLEAHRALFAPLVEGKVVDRPSALRDAANARRADCGGPLPPDGFPPLYSDLGYLLAGEAASRAASLPLSEVVRREVTEPLGLDLDSAEGWERRLPDFRDRVAPTEVVAFRGGEILGVVHDENAWALAKTGLSGHAGLFGTAASVAAFGVGVLDALAGRAPDWLAPEELEPLVRVRQGGTLRAGFDGRSPEGSSAGSRFGPRSFGHLGFTGTSLWCDPDAGVVAVILTNRVNPSRENVAIRAVRPLLNDVLHERAGLLRR